MARADKQKILWDALQLKLLLLLQQKSNVKKESTFFLLESPRPQIRRHAPSLFIIIPPFCQKPLNVGLTTLLDKWSFVGTWIIESKLFPSLSVSLPLYWEANTRLLSPSLSLSFLHTHMHPHILVHTRIRLSMKGCNRQPAVFWLWHSSTHTHTLPHTHTNPHTHYLSFSISLSLSLSLSQSAVMQLTGPEMLMRVQWRVGERGWGWGRGTETLKTKNSIKSCARHSPSGWLFYYSIAV